MRKVIKYVVIGGLVLTVLLFSSMARAGKNPDQYPTETYAASRVAYQLLLNGIEIIDKCEIVTKARCGVITYVRTHQEPAVCWPFPIEWEVFYRTIQDDVNAEVESHPKRDQGKLGYLVGWYVWHSLQQNWGC